MNTNKFVHTAISELNKLPGVSASIDIFENNGHALASKSKTDGNLTVVLDGKKRIFPVEIKKGMRSIHLHGVLELAKLNPGLVLITDRFYPALFDKIVNSGVNYIDSTGRIYFQSEGVRIFAEGFGNPPESKSKSATSFSASAMKVVFFLLNRPANSLGTYREFAEAGGTSLGNAHKIIARLKQDKYILKAGNKLRLHNREKLFMMWAETYSKTLKPKLAVEKFRFTDEETKATWKNIALDNISAWGGEPGADLLTKNLRPSVFTLYTNADIAKIIKKFKVVPSNDNPDLYLFRMFWDRAQTVNGYAPPMIIYADLIGTDDARNHEIANNIYEKEIKQRFS